MDAGEPFLRYQTSGESRDHPILPLDVCRIGRGVDNQIVLTDASASRAHAMIRCDKDGFCILSDVGSSNGTSVNGQPVMKAVQLSDGDRITIGQQALIFHQPIAPQLPRDKVEGPRTIVHLATSVITVLVSDIRGFTMLSTQLGEERISALMSAYNQGAGEILRDRRAWSQKFIGDAVMAVWVHDSPQVDRQTFATVLDTIQALQELVAPLQSRFGLPAPIQFGVGINSGSASVGNIGSAIASDFTAVGETVNKAFRLEAATKEAACNILIGRDCLDLLNPPLGDAHGLLIRELDLKGFEGGQSAYALNFADVPTLARAVLLPRAEITNVPKFGATG